MTSKSNRKMRAFRLPEKTIIRLEAMGVLYGSKTAAVIAAINDLYRSEINVRNKIEQYIDTQARAREAGND